MASRRALVAGLAAALVAGVALAAEGDDFSARAEPLPGGASGTSITITNTGTTTLRCARVNVGKAIAGHDSPDGRTWQVGAPGELRSGDLNLAPGQSTTLNVRTEQPVNEGDEISIAVSSDCETDVPKTFVQSAPPPVDGPDLHVEVERLDPLETDAFTAGDVEKLGALFLARVSVTNRGAEPAHDVVLVISIPKQPRLQRALGGEAPVWPATRAQDVRLYFDSEGRYVRTTSGPRYWRIDADEEDDCQDSTGRSFTCDYGTLAPEAARHVVLPFAVAGAGELELSAAATTSSREAQQYTNRGSISVEFFGVPDSGDPACGRGGRAGSSGRCDTSTRRVPAGAAVTLRGRARGAEAVDVGILRLRRGATFAGRKFVCEWVKNKRAQFVPGHAKRSKCLRPGAMLRAKGTKNWELALRRPLPRGRYLVITRAVGAGGISEVSFTARDGNRLKLIVG